KVLQIGRKRTRTPGSKEDIGKKRHAGVERRIQCRVHPDTREIQPHLDKLSRDIIRAPAGTAVASTPGSSIRAIVGRRGGIVGQSTTKGSGACLTYHRGIAIGAERVKT